MPKIIREAIIIIETDEEDYSMNVNTILADIFFKKDCVLEGEIKELGYKNIIDLKYKSKK